MLFIFFLCSLQQFYHLLSKSSMQYFKSTAKSVWNNSKKYIVDTRSPAAKLIDQLQLSQQEILSTNKLNQLAAMTYEIEPFEQITDILQKRIKVFKYEVKQAQKTLNLMITINYLIKHGATGFVDEFRTYISYFKQYLQLQNQPIYENDLKVQQQFEKLLEKIKSRAQHIKILLEDKSKLLKEKQLSMLIKQKMKIYREKKFTEMSMSISSSEQPHQEEQKKNNIKQRMSNITNQLDGIMQNYLWKYIDKLDDKIQLISDKVMQKIDQYVVGNNPQNNFQFDDEEEGPQQKKQESLKKQDSLDDDQFMKKLQKQGDSSVKVNDNLLDFQEYAPNPSKSHKNEDLI